MPKRKTIDVNRVKDHANMMLANSSDELPDEARYAIAAVLEWVLMDTGNYRGFGHVPGTWDFTKNPPEMIGNESRRHYY